MSLWRFNKKLHLKTLNRHFINFVSSVIILTKILWFASSLWMKPISDINNEIKWYHLLISSCGFELDDRDQDILKDT